MVLALGLSLIIRTQQTQVHEAFTTGFRVWGFGFRVWGLGVRVFLEALLNQKGVLVTRVRWGL